MLKIFDHPSTGRILLVAIAASWLAGCGGDAAEAGPPPLPEVPEEARDGGTAVMASAVDITTMNPAATTEFLDAQMQKHVLLMTLLRLDAEGEFQPYLAERWEVNDDTTQVVFHLREDIAWHDDTPTTARDVEFTFNSLKMPNTGFPNRDWFDQWEGAEVLSPHTIRFVVNRHPGFLYGWSQLPIMPRHRFQGTDPEQLATHPFGSAEPVGNGPFRFVERRPGDRWVFEADPAFPDELGTPHLERLVYRVIVDNATLLAELRAGDVDLVFDASPSQLAQTKSDPELEASTYPGRGYAAIVWNGRRSLFEDAAVRRALTMAIDRAGLVAAVRYGLGAVANGPVGPWHPAHDDALQPLPYAPDQAAAALATAGWVDSDGDGTRDKNGTEFEFQLSISERADYADIAEIVQSQLAQVGVSMSVRVQDGASLGAAITSPDRRFDAVLLVWEPDAQIDDRPLFSCSQLGEVYQFASYCNPALDPVLDSIPVTVNPEDQARLYRAYQRAVAEDQPFSFLYFVTEASLHRRGLRGVDLDARGPLAGVTDWWVHPDRRQP